MTEKPENTPGMIWENTGMIVENSTEHTASRRRRKRSKKRDKDNKPRNFPLHTMKNLLQFRNKLHQEVRQYMLEANGIDIGISFNWNNTVSWILIILAIIAEEITAWKLCQRYLNRQDAEDKEGMNNITPSM